MKSVVVGAGPSGLIAARRLLENGFDFDVFEQSDTLGGTWVYTDYVGVNKYGLQSTCMYEDLITNIPKELMVCAGFPFPEDKNKSYISQVEVLEYYNSFAEAYDLKKYIQYYTRVVRIAPCNEEWIVTTQNIKTKETRSQIYQHVFVCNGRFSHPFIPEIHGDDLFQGIKVHSNEFRSATKFADKRVLIVGGKRSGQDLTRRIVKVAEHVILSTREDDYIDKHKKLTIKPEVTELTKNGAVFEDKTTELVDIILYCTGYVYVCPFINEDCGVTIENNGAVPLYKQIINIKYPTMYFIAIPYVVSGTLIFDLQVRFIMAVMTKKIRLPSKGYMLKEFKDFIRDKENNNIPKKHIYRIPTSAECIVYCKELSEIAKIPTVPMVYFDLFEKIKCDSNPNGCYKISNEETFIEIDSSF